MKKWILYSLLLISFLGYNQTDTLDYNPYYIKKYNENFYPFTFVNARNYSLEIYDNAQTNYTTYYPDAKTSLGFGFDYKWMTLSYSFALTRKRNEDSKNINFTYGITRRKFRFSFLYQNYKGFSQLSEQANNSPIPDSLIPYRPHLQNKSYNLSGFYIPNGKKASYRGSFLYFEKQLRSSGSFTFGGEVNYASIRAHKSLIPAQNNPDTVIAENKLFKRASNVNLGLTLGGFYTFVLGKKFHFSSHLSLGFYYDVDLEGKKHGPLSGNSKFGTGVDYQFLLGYDNNKYFAGLTLKGKSYSKVGIENTFDINYTLLEFYFGKRFNLQFNKGNRFIKFD